ncbi:hypothetical protein MBOVa_0980 [Mycoplasmopsis bovis 8790]|nr:hypothetical protein MBOVa_0980 [Mycoplasmopsis bovis 8790]
MERIKEELRILTSESPDLKKLIDDVKKYYKVLYDKDFEDIQKFIAEANEQEEKTAKELKQLESELATLKKEKSKLEDELKSLNIDNNLITDLEKKYELSEEAFDKKAYEYETEIQNIYKQIDKLNVLIKYFDKLVSGDWFSIYDASISGLDIYAHDTKAEFANADKRNADNILKRIRDKAESSSNANLIIRDKVNGNGNKADKELINRWINGVNNNKQN